VSSERKIIDAHAMLGNEVYLALEEGELVRRMDAAGIDLAIARPMGRGLVVDHREGNDLVLKTGPRIRGLASVNPWWGRPALEELKRCRDLGAVGIFLDPLRQGFFPTEDIATPIYEFAAVYNWPIMFRTGTYVFADVIAVLEVARRFPQVEFIAGFGGYADMWFEMSAAIGAVPNLHLDGSLLWAEGIEEVINAHGASRVLFGSAEPRNRYRIALRSLERLELSDVVKRAVMSENAERIFKITV
jgi:predicted TIM-barrel fold metal-dependent hydrolase